MKVYLDTSVYNRPFDDQSQPRVWLEAGAFAVILRLIESNEVDLVVSTVNRYETAQNPSIADRVIIEGWFNLAHENRRVDGAIAQRASELERDGLKALDALHLACAESAAVDWFVTCDDRLIKRYDAKRVHVGTPLDFVQHALGDRE